MAGRIHGSGTRPLLPYGLLLLYESHLPYGLLPPYERFVEARVVRSAVECPWSSAAGAAG
uniref:Transposase n=1 Tax=Streptomyces sp. NBC_01393 TaxID=2903851 RepID=A0AAU3HNU7_9ACTN